MKIILAVTGSISAYKTPDIARGLIKQGHEVIVLLSKGSLNFINPKVFKYLGVTKTYGPDDDFKHKEVLHINLAKWVDSFVLCPLSANKLATLAQGQAQDLIDSVFLSLSPEKVKVLCPAMNPMMLHNPLTQKNFHALSHNLRNLYVIAPDHGILACGDEGQGKLPDTRALVDLIPTFGNEIFNEKILITAGATLSPVDKVRYITNPAKGGTSYELALQALARGYEVEVIKGKFSLKEFDYLKKHPRCKVSEVITTLDLLKKVKHSRYDVYISPMAVSDLEFEYAHTKLKKKDMDGKLSYKIADDVLAYVLEHRKMGQKIIGFAAESELSPKVIKEKIKRKPVDLLVANVVDGGFTTDAQKGFGTVDGEYKLVTKTKTKHYPKLTKKELAALLLDFLETEKL